MAGREILIKNVAQAIPLYVMSCFKIPANIIHSIESMLANFWWGGQGNNQKIHWCSWPKLNQPKKEGGMGFRNLSAFNEAMLAKQGWRLVIDNSSLLARSMKARYYSNSDFLATTLHGNPSFSWRSIVGAR